ncbi:hypothetical protein [Streptomyces winkii]|uniref:hypothetical protein n=1 Tax=Streptomyces winkii TaxID=3051178 RepID=UPI0028D68A51|nr:hypothetical protein [Streptomyces sp. DSM 40971]
MATDSAESEKRNAARYRQLSLAIANAAPALGVYSAIRLTGLLAVVVSAWVMGKEPAILLGGSWDSAWYARIATVGYGTVVKDGSGFTYNDLAFFPLFPGLERGVTTVLPVAPMEAGIIAACLAALAAAWGLYSVGTVVHSRSTGIWLAALWGALPNAVVQTMAYSESLLTALAAWSLYAALTRRWLWSGSLAVLAGLTRPNGFAVALAVVCAAAVALRRDPESRGDWRTWTAPAMAPLGYLGYIAWVGVRTGTPLGYFTVQRGWGSRFDFGRFTVGFAREQLLRGPTRLSYLVAAVVVAAALVGLLLVLRARLPLPLVVYTIAIMVVALGGSHYFSAKPRLLMPAFPLLLPVAIAAGGARMRISGSLVGACAVLSVVYGVHLVMVSPTAP